MSEHSWTIHANGTIDIVIDGILFSGIVPYVNEHPVFALSVSCERDSVTYVTDQAVITTRVSSEGSELVLSCTADIKGDVHDIEPVGSAGIEGADSVYVQGLGMEGPSGFHKISDEAYRSYGLIGLAGECNSVSIFTVDHRRFETGFSVEKKQNMYSSHDVLSCGINLEGKVKGKIELPALHFLPGKDLMTCMKEAAEKIAAEMHARTSMPPAYHWCSWYYYYENMSQEILDGFLDDIKEEKVPFRYIQVDAGYVDHTGDWDRINSRYPEGLGKAAESILSSGYNAGIWMAPFMVGDKSELYKAHPDWIVRNLDGSPYVVFRSYTEPKIWGNTDNDYFILDTTNPGAFGFIEDTFKRLREYGYTLYKIDFLLWCMIDSSKVRRYDESKTSVEVYRDLLDMIRRVIGDDSYLIASIAPYMPSIGYADAARIAGDMGAAWSGAYGPENLLKELPYDNYFNNIFWQNDPDSVILRDFGTHLTEKETISLALLQALSGGVITTSDPVSEIPESRKELLEFIRPDEQAHAEMPFLLDGKQEIVITHKLHDWNLLYVLNPTDHPVDVIYKMDELFGKEALFQYRFNFNDGKTIESEKISYFSDSIAPHDSVLLFVTEKPLKEKPTNLWHR